MDDLIIDNKYEITYNLEADELADQNGIEQGMIITEAMGSVYTYKGTAPDISPYSNLGVNVFIFESDANASNVRFIQAKNEIGTIIPNIYLSLGGVDNGENEFDLLAQALIFPKNLIEQQVVEGTKNMIHNNNMKLWKFAIKSLPETDVKYILDNKLVMKPKIQEKLQEKLDQINNRNGGKRRTKRRRQRSNKKRTNKRKKTKTRMKRRKTSKRKTNKRRRKR